MDQTSSESSTKGPPQARAMVRQAAQAVQAAVDVCSSQEQVARSCLAAIDAHDARSAAEHWSSSGWLQVHGLPQARGPAEVEALLAQLLSSVPDASLEVLDATSAGESCAVRWRLKGTFAGTRFNGVAATASPLTIVGVDLIEVADGLIQSSEVFVHSADLPRAIQGVASERSPSQRLLVAAHNFRSRLRYASMPRPRLIATGVWVLQGQPGRCNVYLIEDDRGVTLFDAGARTMAPSIASAAARLGGIRRIVLGHAHTDHRGSAPSLEVPVLCHPDELEDAEGSGGFRYWPAKLEGLPAPQRQVHRLLHRLAWDGGPVQIEGTVQEGDLIASFEVIHLPGHAPGQIALWRRQDRLALCSDCFYTLDMWGFDCEAHVPEAVYNLDIQQARASIVKLAALEPAIAWPGHGNALAGEVRRRLEAAAGAR